MSFGQPEQPAQVVNNAGDGYVAGMQIPEPRWHRLASRPLRSLRIGTPHAGVPEMVVVPGLGALGYLLPMVRACGSWTRVHVLDVPGFGHPSTARCPASLRDTSRAVAEWVDAVPRDRVVLMGHSTGAQAALHAAAELSRPPRQLVLAGPTFPPEARRWRPLVARMARTLLHESPGELIAILPDYLRGRAGVLTLLRSAMADEPEKLLPRMSCPVVVLRGEHDAVSPASWADRLAAAAASGRVITVPGAHNFTYTEPEAASTALCEIWDAIIGNRPPPEENRS